METIIDLYRDIVVQIANPYSLGTGFYLGDYDLIVTNEHVIRGNEYVVLNGHSFEEHLSKVLFVDEHLDLAFLDASKLRQNTTGEICANSDLQIGEEIMAIGHPFGLKFSFTKGIVSNPKIVKNNLEFIQHDAALNPGNSGGPLVNQKGKIIGVNSFSIVDGNSIGFSLPIRYVKQNIDKFIDAGKQISAICTSCHTIVSENKIENKYCFNCGSEVKLPNVVDEYLPLGMGVTIEAMLTSLGYDVQLSRRGLNSWEVKRGSARIKISYHEETGLIMGDAYLCTIPKSDIISVYNMMLKENYTLEGLTFSVKGQDIILSLLIYDKYFDDQTSKLFFNTLFEKADYYDNVLVEEYGAFWKPENQ